MMPVICMMAMAMGCNQGSQDRDIRGAIAAKTKTDIHFAGVQYTVKDGVVTLVGTCPTLKAKEQVLKTLRGIRVIKDVKDELRIAPLVLDSTLVFRQAVDSVLARYPYVLAKVSDSAIALQGEVMSGELAGLAKALKQVNPYGSVDTTGLRAVN